MRAHFTTTMVIIVTTHLVRLLTWIVAAELVPIVTCLAFGGIMGKPADVCLPQTQYVAIIGMLAYLADTLDRRRDP